MGENCNKLSEKEFDINKTLGDLQTGQNEIKKALENIAKNLSASNNEEPNSLFGNKSKKEINKLKDILDEKEEKIKKLECERERNKTEINNLKSAIEKKDLEIEKNVSMQMEQKQKIISLEQEKEKIDTSYKNKYADFEVAYENFLSLSEETKNGLKNIFANETMQCFIAAGVQWENISSIWEYTKRCFIESSVNDATKLRNLFLFFFNLYNKKSRHEEYVLISPNEGEKFNSDFHVVLGGKTGNVVSKCVFIGYKNISGKRVCKALVEV